ncbi:hypothetical protein bthur0011_57930 [Bacillus thuringiensis serovar huazhongensis BGSC 4BD1]|nr:hypothetical protein bthur0011_57930 [Bacillus thuringiensis serovar huazhongensis BGSC 4BD1]
MREIVLKYILQEDMKEKGFSFVLQRKNMRILSIGLNEMATIVIQA